MYLPCYQDFTRHSNNYLDLRYVFHKQLYHLIEYFDDLIGLTRRLDLKWRKLHLYLFRLLRWYLHGFYRFSHTLRNCFIRYLRLLGLYLLALFLKKVIFGVWLSERRFMNLFKPLILHLWQRFLKGLPYHRMQWAYELLLNPFSTIFLCLTNSNTQQNFLQLCDFLERPTWSWA